MSHSHLIDQLGGTGAVCKKLGVRPSQVANWRERGISWQWRPAIAELAKTLKVALPDDFLSPSSARPEIPETAANG